ncbi:MAG: SagB/ThcOx family dehydrogenase [Acidobacteriota bacterium]
MILNRLFQRDQKKHRSVDGNDALDMVFHYHFETKHRFERYARGPGYLDWANQPDPFRRFAGAPVIELPFLTSDDTPSYHSLYKNEAIMPKKVSLHSVAQLFELSLAISAWKEYRSTRWSLRINPSSGNLHPSEGYLVIGPQQDGGELAGLGTDAMVCHYAPDTHELECRTRFPLACWHTLMRSFPVGCFLVGLTSIHWREAWKYGERAFRYCQHDIGHALAAYRFSAALLGWQLIVLEELSDSKIARLFGIDRANDFENAEREHPALVALVVPHRIETAIPLTLSDEAIEELAASNWYGKANRLSNQHRDWNIIDWVASACEKPQTNCGMRAVGAPQGLPVALTEPQQWQHLSARQIIFQRRSAVAFDARTEIYAADFYRMLARTIPSKEPVQALVPWDTIVWPPCVHLCLFVHRIHELLPGLYVLVRDPDKIDLLRATMQREFLWQKPPQCPDELPLYFLMEGNCQTLASQVSCTQDIAGDSAFSLGMVAEFEQPLEKFGAWYYRRLFWETGMIGQILYLEAESIGIRSTGIGCFFDDPVHEVFGFADGKFQSLYHFTIGGALEDQRLTTLPPYTDSLKRSRI